MFQKRTQFNDDLLTLKKLNDFFYFEEMKQSYQAHRQFLCTDAAVKICLNDNDFIIEFLEESGILNRSYFSKKYQVRQLEQGKIAINYEAYPDLYQETLDYLSSKNLKLLGLFGAFAFEYICRFYPIGRHKDSSKNDAVFVYYKTVYSLLVEKNELELESEIFDRLNIGSTIKESVSDFSISAMTSHSTKEQFSKQLNQLRHHFKQGDIYEAVLARKFSAHFEGSALSLFKAYRNLNRSTYNFYFKINDFCILGCSPEMMIRIDENRSIDTRPISGTARRGKDAFDDYDKQMQLLSSEKEKSELDMLIDLARNDLNRICESEVSISDYRFVEKYSRVMHTVAHIRGKLTAGVSPFSAYRFCLNAGTLSGTPKVSAINIIHALENSPRGFYGSAIAYFLPSSITNSAITIRSAFIESNYLSYYSGITALLESDISAEFDETEAKAAAFFEAIQSNRSQSA